MGKIHHARERGKFRMTENNKQSQEVGSQEKFVAAVCFFKTSWEESGVYEKEEKSLTRRG